MGVSSKEYNDFSNDNLKNCNSWVLLGFPAQTYGRQKFKDKAVWQE